MFSTLSLKSNTINDSQGSKRPSRSISTSSKATTTSTSTAQSNSISELALPSSPISVTFSEASIQTPRASFPFTEPSVHVVQHVPPFTLAEFEHFVFAALDPDPNQKESTSGAAKSKSKSRAIKGATAYSEPEVSFPGTRVRIRSSASTSASSPSCHHRPEFRRKNSESAWNFSGGVGDYSGSDWENLDALDDDDQIRIYSQPSPALSRRRNSLKDPERSENSRVCEEGRLVTVDLKRPRVRFSIAGEAELVDLESLPEAGSLLNDDGDGDVPLRFGGRLGKSPTIAIESKGECEDLLEDWTSKMDVDALDEWPIIDSSDMVNTPEFDPSQSRVRLDSTSRCGSWLRGTSTRSVSHAQTMSIITPSPTAATSRPHEFGDWNFETATPNSKLVRGAAILVDETVGPTDIPGRDPWEKIEKFNLPTVTPTFEYSRYDSDRAYQRRTDIQIPGNTTTRKFRPSHRRTHAIHLHPNQRSNLPTPKRGSTRRKQKPPYLEICLPPPLDFIPEFESASVDFGFNFDWEIGVEDEVAEGKEELGEGIGAGVKLFEEKRRGGKDEFEEDRRRELLGGSNLFLAATGNTSTSNSTGTETDSRKSESALGATNPRQNIKAFDLELEVEEGKLVFIEGANTEDEKLEERNKQTPEKEQEQTKFESPTIPQCSFIHIYRSAPARFTRKREFKLNTNTRDRNTGHSNQHQTIPIPNINLNRNRKFKVYETACFSPDFDENEINTNTINTTNFINPPNQNTMILLAPPPTAPTAATPTNWNGNVQLTPASTSTVDLGLHGCLSVSLSASGSGRARGDASGIPEENAKREENANGQSKVGMLAPSSQPGKNLFSRIKRQLSRNSMISSSPSSPSTSASTSVPVALMIPTYETSTSTASATFASGLGPIITSAPTKKGKKSKSKKGADQLVQSEEQSMIITHSPSPLRLGHHERPASYTPSTDSMSSSSLPFAPGGLESASVECVTMRDERETSEGSSDASERTTTTRSASGSASGEGRRRRKKKTKADKKIVRNSNGSGQMRRIRNEDSFISLVDEDDIDSDIENVVGPGATATSAASAPPLMYFCSSGTENEKKESSNFKFAPYIPFVVQHERTLQQQQQYQHQYPPNSKLSTPPIPARSSARPSPSPTTLTSTSTSRRPRSKVPPPLKHPVPPFSALPPSPSPSLSRSSLPSLRPLPFRSPKQTLPVSPISPTTPGTPTWPTSPDGSRSSIESRGPVTPCTPGFRFVREDEQEDENGEEGRRHRDSAGSASMNGSGKSTTLQIQPLRNGGILAKSRSRQSLTLSSLSPPPPSSPPPSVPLPLPPLPHILSSTTVPLGLKKKPSTLNPHQHDEVEVVHLDLDPIQSHINDIDASSDRVDLDSVLDVGIGMGYRREDGLASGYTVGYAHSSYSYLGVEDEHQLEHEEEDFDFFRSFATSTYLNRPSRFRSTSGQEHRHAHGHRPQLSVSTTSSITSSSQNAITSSSNLNSQPDLTRTSSESNPDSVLTASASTSSLNFSDLKSDSRPNPTSSSEASSADVFSEAESEAEAREAELLLAANTLHNARINRFGFGGAAEDAAKIGVGRKVVVSSKTIRNVNSNPNGKRESGGEWTLGLGGSRGMFTGLNGKKDDRKESGRERGYSTVSAMSTDSSGFSSLYSVAAPTITSAGTSVCSSSSVQVVASISSSGRVEKEEAQRESGESPVEKDQGHHLSVREPSLSTGMSSRAPSTLGTSNSTFFTAPSTINMTISPSSTSSYQGFRTRTQSDPSSVASSSILSGNENEYEDIDDNVNGAANEDWTLSLGIPSPSKGKGKGKRNVLGLEMFKGGLNVGGSGARYSDPTPSASRLEFGKDDASDTGGPHHKLVINIEDVDAQMGVDNEKEIVAGVEVEVPRSPTKTRSSMGLVVPRMVSNGSLKIALNENTAQYEAEESPELRVPVIQVDSVAESDGEKEERNTDPRTQALKNTKANLATLDALSADLKRFNEMLRAAASSGLGKKRSSSSNLVTSSVVIDGAAGHKLKKSKSRSVLQIDEPPPPNAVLRRMPSADTLFVDALGVGMELGVDDGEDDNAKGEDSNGPLVMSLSGIAGVSRERMGSITSLSSNASTSTPAAGSSSSKLPRTPLPFTSISKSKSFTNDRLLKPESAFTLAMTKPKPRALSLREVSTLGPVSAFEGGVPMVVHGMQRRGSAPSVVGGLKIDTNSSSGVKNGARSNLRTVGQTATSSLLSPNVGLRLSSTSSSSLNSVTSIDSSTSSTPTVTPTRTSPVDLDIIEAESPISPTSFAAVAKAHSDIRVSPSSSSPSSSDTSKGTSFLSLLSPTTSSSSPPSQPTSPSPAITSISTISLFPMPPLCALAIESPVEERASSALSRSSIRRSTSHADADAHSDDHEKKSPSNSMYSMYSSRSAYSTATSGFSEDVEYYSARSSLSV